MALIKWSERFSVNIKVIDEDHMKLAGLINTLYDAMCMGKGNDVLGKVLTDLIDYTVYHFRTEEDFFESYGYSEFRQHKKEHDELTNQAVELKNKHDRGEVVLTIEVMNFLRDWLINHILDSDKKYISFLNSKGVV